MGRKQFFLYVYYLTVIIVLFLEARYGSTSVSNSFSLLFSSFISPSLMINRICQKSQNVLRVSSHVFSLVQIRLLCGSEQGVRLAYRMLSF